MSFVLYSLVLLAAGAAWNFHLGMAPVALSLLLPVVATRIKTWPRRWAAAAGYMAASMFSIAQSYPVFFPGASAFFGALLWLGAAVVAGAPYMIAKDGKRAVLAALLQALPPLGVIAFVSPLDASGLLFPHMGLSGVVLLLVLIYVWCDGLESMLKPGGGYVAKDTFWTTLKPNLALLLPLLAMIMHFWIGASQPQAPSAWTGVSTVHLMPDRGNVFASLANTNDVVQSASRAAPSAKFVLLPEAVLGDAYPGTLADVQNAVLKGKTWLIGVENGRTDSVWEFSRGVRPHPVFESAMPMPGAMWRPWSPRSYAAQWFTRVRRIGTEKVFASICDEQVMPWVWLEAAWQRPTLILAPSNAWWAASHNAAPRIQRLQLRAWASLLNAPVIRAINSR